MSATRLSELLSRAADGTIDTAGAAEAVRLLADPGLAAGALADRRAEVALAALLAPAAPEQAARQVLLALSAVRPSARRRVQTRVRRLRPGRPWVRLAIAATLMLAIGAWFAGRSSAGSATDALTTIAASPVARTLARGDRLMVERGSIVVAGPDRLHLRDGSIAIEAVPRPTGAPLTVDLPGAQVAVVGTRFAIATTATGADVTVAHGAVRCRAGAGPWSAITADGSWTLAGDVVRVVKAERLIDHPFTSESLERFLGMPIAGIGPAGRRSLTAAVVNVTAGDAGVYLSDWDHALTVLRGDEQLRVAVWLDAGAPEPLLRIDELAGGRFHGRRLTLPRGRWVDLDIALADLPPLAGATAPPAAGWRLAEIALLLPIAHRDALHIADLRLVRLTVSEEKVR